MGTATSDVTTPEREQIALTGSDGVRSYPPLRQRDIFRAWYPLALSWMFMALEVPIANSYVARLPDPEIGFAVYGSIVFPVAALIEAPVLSFLAASTALSRSKAQFLALRRFVHIWSAVLTLAHLALTFTPLFDVVLVQIVGMPLEYYERAFWTMVALTPLTWAVAYRRFHQGALIAAGLSRVVGRGTMLRLASVIVSAEICVHAGLENGALLAAISISFALIVEAAFSAWMSYRNVLPNLAQQSSASLMGARELTWYYVPLAATSVLGMLVPPLGTAALSRMPGAVEALAIWPLVSGVSFLCRTGAIANNEVMVALYDREGGREQLARFVLLVGLGSAGAVLLFALTPLGDLWFKGLFRLNDERAHRAAHALLFAAPGAIFSAVYSWYYGILVLQRRTRPINEAVALFLGVAFILLFGGVWLQTEASLELGMFAFTIAQLASVLWLRRARPAGDWRAIA